MTEQKPKEWKPGDVAIADGYGQALGRSDAEVFRGATVRVVNAYSSFAEVEWAARTYSIHVRNLSEPPKPKPDCFHCSTPPRCDRCGDTCIECGQVYPKAEPPKEEPKPGTWRHGARCEDLQGRGPEESAFGSALSAIYKYSEVYRATNQTGPVGWQPDTRKGERRVGKPRVIQVGEEIEVVTRRRVRVRRMVEPWNREPSSWTALDDSKVEYRPLERRTAQGEQRKVPQ